MDTINWKRRALCRGMDPAIFFPQSEEDHKTAAWEAKKICVGCPVLEECFDTYRGEPYGIFGGTTGMDRKRIRNRRKTPQQIWAKTRERFNLKPVYDREAIREMADHGMTAPEIALKLGAPRSTIWSILHRNQQSADESLTAGCGGVAV